MLDIFRRNPGALVAAVVLHLVLAVLLIVGADWFAPNEVVKPQIVQATIVNSKSLHAEVERLRKADAKRQAEHEKAQTASERAKVQAEQKRIQALKEERRRHEAEARAEAEAKRAAAEEAARQAEAKREAEEAARQKAAAAAKRQAAAKAAAEARAKAEAEKARQAQEAAARAKREAAARARAEAAAAAEKKRQAQEAARRSAAAEAKREAAAKAKAEVAARAKAEAKQQAAAKAKAKAEAEARRKAAEAVQRARENDLLSDLNAERDAREIQRYAALIDQRIRQVWLRPLGTSGDLVCTVDVRMLPGGEVVPGSVHIVQSSGNDAFDRSVIAAVYKASPLPVPSGQLFQQFREPHLTFKAQN
jgi:colicin import membrane protein